MVDIGYAAAQSLVSATVGAYLGLFLKSKSEQVQWRKEQVYEPLFDEVSKIADLEHPYGVKAFTDGGESEWESIDPSVKIRLSSDFVEKMDQYSSLIDAVNRFWNDVNSIAAEALAENGYFDTFIEEFPNLIEDSSGGEHPGPKLILDTADLKLYVNDIEDPSEGYQTIPLHSWLFDLDTSIFHQNSSSELRNAVENSEVNAQYWDNEHPGWEDDMWEVLKNFGENQVEDESEPTGWLSVRTQAVNGAQISMQVYFKELVELSSEIEDRISTRLQRNSYNPLSWV